MKDYPLHFPPILTSEQERSLHQAVHDFVNREIMPFPSQLEEDTALQEKIRRLLVDVGLQKLSLPGEYGGEGIRGALLNVVIWEELSRGDVGIAVSHRCDHPETYGPGKGSLAARMNTARIMSERAVRCAEKALQLMGSHGYAPESHVEKYRRDSLMITLWKGGTRLSGHNPCRGYYDLGI